MQKFYLTWDDSRHSLGIASIDQQHRGLMDMVNNLSEEVVHGYDLEKVLQQIDQILIYTEDHFSHEEQLMRDHGFPDLERHTVEHATLLGEIATLRETLKPDHPGRVMLVTAFLADCAERHILTEDRALAEHLRNSGIG